MFISVKVGLQFVDYLYDIYIGKVRDNLSNSHGKRMADYIKENYKIDLSSVLSQIADNYSIGVYNNMYELEPNTNIKEKESNTQMSVLIRLIDKGNRDIKGTNAFTDAERFIENHIREIYTSYMYRKERENVS